MISVTDALQLTLNAVPMLDAQKIPLHEAVGTVLAEEVVSDLDMPPFDKSSMDGFALCAEDTAQAPATLEVMGTIPAGIMPDFKINSGQAAKIMTGAPLPAGANAVQQVEKTRQSNSETVTILEPVRPGQNVANRGELMRTGDAILKQGVLISPATIGLLATVGYSEIVSHRRPKVGILATGDELVDVTEKPLAGQIRNSNGPGLFSQVRTAGALPIALGIARDDKSELREKIGAGLENDVLLISGGVSMGEFDLVESVLAEFGLEVLFDSVNIKPGKPTVFGMCNTKPVFGLAGNPVSSSTIFDILVLPALRKMMGWSGFRNPEVSAVLERDYKSRTRRDTYHPAVTTMRNGEFRVMPLASKGSADVLTFSKCNSFLIAPGQIDEYQKGDKISVILRVDFWQSVFSN